MSFHTAQTFTYGETPSATKWNYLWENDYALADGTGIEDDAIIARHITDAVITPAKLTSAARWWEEIGRTTLGVAGDTISVTPITAKKYIKILISVVGSGAINLDMKFNNDTSNNYAYRRSINGGAEDNQTSQGAIQLQDSTSALPMFSEVEVLNISAQEKMIIGHTIRQNTAGAGNAPARVEVVGKWVNTSAQITRIDIVNALAGDFAIGSEVVVLGHD